jgi:hypothetical protein
MNDSPRIPLYARLPEIYRIRDEEQLPPGQLKAYLGAIEAAFSALHENIEALYEDLFIETCDDWVIPYIADLLGISHLQGEPWTLRADVADTIALRRRKGSLGAIERLAANLTGWPCRAVELAPNLAWTQHLNHQRPDAGGRPPWGAAEVTRFTPRRGGTAVIRDPAILSLVGTAFDPFAYTPDLKRADDGAKHINLPNLAIHLWRLQDYRLAVTRPLLKGITNLGAPPPDSNRARFALRFDLDPLDRPVRLFQSYQRPEPDPATGIHPLTAADAVAAPILPGRLEEGSEAGNPWAYVSVDAFTDAPTGPEGLDIADVGLQLYHPEAGALDGVDWRIRAANLCAWEDGLKAEIAAHDIIIDPEIGRVLIGLSSLAQRNAMVSGPEAALSPRVLFGYTYGAVGPIGAHPVSRDLTPSPGAELRIVNQLDPALPSLQASLANLQDETGPVVVEIRDSMVHDLDPASLVGAQNESGLVAARLARSLTIRAASGARPVLRLAAPLAFRPADPAAPEVEGTVLTLDGLFLTSASPTEPILARAAVARVEITGCTLDPGGHLRRDGTRAPLAPAMRLANGYGFANPADEDAFAPTPDIVISRSVTGRIAIDDEYRLTLQDSVIDGGMGPDDPIPAIPAIGPATPSAEPHAAPTSLTGVTVLGPALLEEARGSGAIFTGPLDVWNHQVGCLKLSYLSGLGDTLPPHFACVFGANAHLRFTSVRHGAPGYAQLARGTDFRITDRGPGDEAMGATGLLFEAHKRINLNVRLRELMPLGVRPLRLLMN